MHEYGHSRPQSPSFLGHVVGKRGVGYKLSRVALGTRIEYDRFCARFSVVIYGETSGDVTRCQLFSQAKLKANKQTNQENKKNIKSKKKYFNLAV